MKKKVAEILVFAMLILLLCGCQNNKKTTETLQVPEYPLNKETVSTALEKSGIVARVEETSVIPEGEWDYEWNSYSIRPLEGNDLCAGLHSGNLDEERFLTMTFLGFDEEKIMTQEEQEKAIIFSTRLFGGFQDEYSVYNAFIEEFNAEESSVWKTELNGIECEIKFQKASDTSRNIMGVSYYTDSSKFVNEELLTQ